MKKLLVASIVAAAFYGAPALAADMPTKAPAYKAVDPIFNWNGFYVGGHIGYQWTKIETEFAPVSLPIPEMNQNTYNGGFQIGLQRQWGNFVAGIEGGMTTLFSDPFHNKKFNVGFDYGARMEDFIVWVGGRLGISMGSWLPYITGGYANGDFNSRFVTGGTNNFVTGVGPSRLNGWYFGAGADLAVAPNWILGVEFRRYDFGPKTSVPHSAAGVPDPGNTYKIDSTSNTVALRLSYLFGSR
jgi:opacity protein-like surface antigen